MSNLLIKNINNISLSNINLIEFRDFYKIIYSYKNISLIGLLFHSQVNIYKILPSKFFVEILDKSILIFLNQLDNYLTKKLNKNNIIVTQYQDKFGLLFNINNITSKILTQKNNKLYFNIKYINKGFNNNPIIHIIY